MTLNLGISKQSELCLVKTIKHDVLIPKGNTVGVTCRVNTKSNTTNKPPVLFEPDPTQPWPTGLEVVETLTNISRGASSRVVIQVINSTDHDILLPNRTVLGRLHLVKSVTPVEVKERCSDKARVSEVLITDQLHKNTPKTADNWIPEVDLNGLTEKQKLVAQQMLAEESDCFSRDDNDIGCSEELNMKVNLTDTTPVQKNYNSIPKPLYPEVKQYIEDLLNRKFIRKSKSAYSSPVVCVRKKDGTLRLCVDYRELTKSPTQSANDTRKHWRKLVVFAFGPRKSVPSRIHRPDRPTSDHFHNPLGVIRMGANPLWSKKRAR